jgi:hypothetical protein
MAETALNYSPPAPTIGPVSSDDRRREGAAGRTLRRPSPAAGDAASETSSHLLFECIALLLQGGGAPGAYQAGVYQAFAGADLHPDWIAGILIDAINGGLIAGNAPEARVASLSRADCDFVYAVSRHGERALSMAVADIVTPATITVAPDDTLKRAMSLMTHHRVRHLPAIADGKLVGIVSIGDVVKHRLEDLETESNVLRDAYLAVH